MLRSGADATRLRSPGFLALLALALLVLSCFEQPVTESLEIHFLPGRAAMVRVVVKLSDPDRFGDNPRARERIDNTRREILDSRDPWTSRLASLEPVSERMIRDLEEGSLVLSDRRVLLEDAGTLKRFFSDTLLLADVTFREAEAEFSLTPGPGARASRPQQEALRREMEKWASSAARYLESCGRLYAYLDENPDRAGACFADVFEDALPADARESHGRLSSADAAVVEPLKKAMEEVLGLFAVPPESAFSLEELSRLVHDPFPAPLLVRVPGPVLESEGFQERGPGILRVPPLGLWEAFQRLRDRWLSPDPALVFYEHLAEGGEPLILEDFLQMPRSAAPPPSEEDLLRALQEDLRAAPVYRVRWSTEDLAEMEDARGSVWDQPALR